MLSFIYYDVLQFNCTFLLSCSFLYFYYFIIYYLKYSLTVIFSCPAHFVLYILQFNCTFQLSCSFFYFYILQFIILYFSIILLIFVLLYITVQLYFSIILLQKIKVPCIKIMHNFGIWQFLLLFRTYILIISCAFLTLNSFYIFIFTWPFYRRNKIRFW